MVLKSEELLGTLTKEAKERQAEFHGNQYTQKKKVDLVSNDDKSTLGKSVDKLAEVAKTSATMVSRMQRLKRESPDKYSEVVAGDKTKGKVKTNFPLHCWRNAQLYLKTTELMLDKQRHCT